MAIIASYYRSLLTIKIADEAKRFTEQQNREQASPEAGAPLQNITADHSPVCKMLPPN